MAASRSRCEGEEVWGRPRPSPRRSRAAAAPPTHLLEYRTRTEGAWQYIKSPLTLTDHFLRTAFSGGTPIFFCRFGSADAVIVQPSAHRGSSTRGEERTCLVFLLYICSVAYPFVYSRIAPFISNPNAILMVLGTTRQDAIR